MNRKTTTVLVASIAIAVPLAMGLASNAGTKNKSAQLAKGSAAETPWQRYGDWPEKDWNTFNTLANSTAPEAATAVMKLDGPITGDPAKGKELAFDRARGGSCVACHIMGPDTPELPGNVGPDLSQLASQRSDEYLFNYIYDPRVYNHQTIMPPWGTNGLFTVDEIKDIVAFIKTLNQPVAFKDAKDDPAKRDKPVEDRDNLDPIENPAMWAVDDAKELFARKGSKGQSCASCHAKPDQAFKTWAASMPRYNKELKKVLGVEEFIARHAEATTGEKWVMQSDENTAMAIYLRHLANGTPINVKLDSEPAKQAAARGEQLMHRKIGQLNFACMDCHSPAKGANKWIRGQWLGESRGQVAHFPTWRTSRGEIWDIRKRFQWCNVAIRANELPPDANEYGDIELYLTHLNNGLPLSVPGIRH